MTHALRCTVDGSAWTSSGVTGKATAPQSSMRRLVVDSRSWIHHTMVVVVVGAHRSSIKTSSKPRPRTQFPPLDESVCTRRAMTRWPLIQFGIFLAAFTPHRSLAATLSSDHGSLRAPTNEVAGGCYLSVECGNRSHESREGCLKHSARQGCFWFRQLCPHDDQSEFPSSSRRSIAS